MSADSAEAGMPTADEPHALRDAQNLLLELRGLALDRLHLAALETRQAGESLVIMLVVGVMVGVLLAGAWFGLIAAAVLLLVEQGVMASNAVLLAVVGNVLLALLLCGLIRHQSHHLQFPATLRSLRSQREAAQP